MVGTAQEFVDGNLQEQKCYGTFREDMPEDDFRFRILFVKHNGDFKMHSHEYSELVVVMDGRATHRNEIGEYELETGDVFVITGNKQHGFKNCQELRLCNIMFDPDQFLTGRKDVEEMMGYQALFDLQPRTLGTGQFHERLHLSPDNLAYASDLISQLGIEYSRNSEGRRLVISSAFNLLVAFLCRLYSRNVENTVSPLTQMANVAAHIRKNFRSEIRLEELAQVANLSVSQLQRKFKKIYTTTPVQYINKLRIHEACEMLKNPNHSITHIAFRCGFGSSSFFSTQFRLHLNESPSSYRQRFTDRVPPIPTESSYL